MTVRRPQSPTPADDGPLARQHRAGQWLWLDYLRRDLLLQNALRTRLERDRIIGVITNPSTFCQAIAWTGQYDAAVEEGVRLGSTRPEPLLEQLVSEDVGSAADQLREIYERSDRREGYVSRLVDASLTLETPEICTQASRWWQTVDKPNLMLEVWPSASGLKAISALIAEGINASAGLVSDLDTHAAVVEAYFLGLETRPGELSGIGSVATIGVGHLYHAVVRSLKGTDGASEENSRFAGSVAASVGCLMYRQWAKLHSGRRWKALAARGARPQRLVFAMAGCEDLDSIMPVVDQLVLRDTVCAMPIGLLDSYRAAHSRPVEPVMDALKADQVLNTAAEKGLILPVVAKQILTEVHDRYLEDLSTTLSAISRKASAVTAGLPPLNPN